jgi:flagellar FliL protein
MAEEEAKKEVIEKKKKGFNFKVILIGLPLFVAQLVLVYFITATFLVKSAPASHSVEDGEQVEEQSEEDAENSEPQKIFNIEDLIINPAGTSGQRLLLLSIGFSVGDEEKLKLLQENEVVIKDIVINTVSKKTLGSLSKIELKDSLKVELAENINSAYPKAKINNVYFSKYLIN